ncbi:threonine synthase [Aquimarina intermedia]|uniref:Threonine synthase n=1 Tax=Aquimarina intermedia TaxID=350814 RepID=A0A5S5C707_9FLAO|nr:threonine synthase [Aquimarina intermedia]TYP75195.1 threonine synthase [Aquimarina intermedia]
MYYYSLNNKNHRVSFEEAVVSGIAPDRGLYFPEKIEKLPASFYNEIDQMSATQIAYMVIEQFIGTSIPKNHLLQILDEVLDFDFPVVPIDESISSLELFHGPTMAFKDVGARFMAKCLEYFNKNNGRKTTVLVATSGDTGGAVANGFFKTDNVEVIILYPQNKVSDVQEKQLTTLGHNITALEVQGTFDDCQEMVKTAFLDEELKSKRNLTSANSINIARWLPQTFYYFIAYKQLKSFNKELVFSVPSGNFGNICAGIVAKKLGLPIRHFVASTNSNDIIPRYLNTGFYSPRPSVETLSNAMDVGNPSNFIRIQHLFKNDDTALKSEFSSYSFNDKETNSAIQELYKTANYIADPHGAVGYLGLKKHGLQPNEIGVFLETAHPIKFRSTVEKELSITLPLPDQIKEIMQKKKNSILIKNYKNLKAFLSK